MTQVIYEYSDGEFWIAEFCREGCESLAVELCDANGRDVFGKHAYIELCGKTLHLKDGSVRISATELSPGELCPTLLWNKRKYALPKLTLRDGKIYLPDSDADHARFVGNRIKAISRQLDELEAKMERLEGCVFRTSIL